MKYEKPEIEIIYFSSEDVITVSPTNPLPIDEGSAGSSFSLY